MEEKDNVQVEPVTEAELPAEETAEEIVADKAADEVAVEEAPKSKASQFFSSFGAKAKEWLRKKIVMLKRKPQTIPMILLLVASVFYLFCLQIYSQSIDKMSFKLGGFSIFVNTLFSILILILFLNTFPKNKKMNIVMLVLVCVFFAAIVAFDVVFIVNFNKVLAVEAGKSPINYVEFPFLKSAVPLTIGHLVLLGIFAVAFATLPLYTKLIRMINTSKNIESSQLNEEIDTEDE